MNYGCLIQQSFGCTVAGIGNFPPPLIQEWGLGYKIYNLHCIDSIWVLNCTSQSVFVVNFHDTVLLSQEVCMTVWHILLLIKKWNSVNTDTEGTIKKILKSTAREKNRTLASLNITICEHWHDVSIK